MIQIKKDIGNEWDNYNLLYNERMQEITAQRVMYPIFGTTFKNLSIFKQRLIFFLFVLWDIGKGSF